MNQRIDIINVTLLTADGSNWIKNDKRKVSLEFQISNQSGKQRSEFSIILDSKKTQPYRISRLKLCKKNGIAINGDGLIMNFERTGNTEVIELLLRKFLESGGKIELPHDNKDDSMKSAPPVSVIPTKANMRRASDPVLPFNRHSQSSFYPEQSKNQLIFQPKPAVKHVPESKPNSENRDKQHEIRSLNDSAGSAKKIELGNKPSKPNPIGLSSSDPSSIEKKDDYLFIDQVLSRPSKTHSLSDPKPIQHLPGLDRSDTKTISHKSGLTSICMSSPKPSTPTLQSPFKSRVPYTYTSSSRTSFIHHDKTAFTSDWGNTPPHDDHIVNVDDEDDMITIQHIREKRLQHFNNPDNMRIVPKPFKKPLNHPDSISSSYSYKHKGSNLSSYFDVTSRLSSDRYTPGYDREDRPSTYSYRGNGSGGMANLGNTCYMSAVMQALIGLPLFSKDMLSKYWEKIMHQVSSSDATSDIRPSSLSTSCLKQVMDIMKQVNSPHGSIGLDNLKAAVDSQFQRFVGNEQHDAHEFFIDLMSNLHEELVSKLSMHLKPLKPYPVPMIVDSHPSPDSHIIPDLHNDSMMSGNNTTSETSIHSYHHDKDVDDGHDDVVDKYLNRIPTQRSFYSEVCNQLTCMQCGYRHEPILEPYTNYGVDLDDDDAHQIDAAHHHDDNNDINKVDNNQDISRSVANYHDIHDDDKENHNLPFVSPISTPTLKSPIPSSSSSSKLLELNSLLDNFFRDDHRELKCESCHAVNSSVKVAKSMQTMPHMLTIHLKRFKYDRMKHATVKIHHPVSFPKILNMMKYTHDDTIAMELPSLDDDQPSSSSSSLSSSSVNTSNGKRQRVDDKISYDDTLSSYQNKNMIHSSNECSTPVLFEDDSGWLCPQCSHTNIQVNAFCGTCIYARSDRKRKSDFSNTYHSPSSTSKYHHNPSSSSSMIPSSPSSSSTSKHYHNPSSPSSSSSSIANDKDDEVMFYHPTPRLFEFSSHIYDLVAVIRHHGSNSAYGHYICDKLIISSDDDTGNINHDDHNGDDMMRRKKQWKRCNDSVVTNITEEAVLQDQATAYMLFYARR